MKPAKHRVTAALYSMIDTPAIEKDIILWSARNADLARKRDVGEMHIQQIRHLKSAISQLQHPDFKHHEYKALLGECHVRLNTAFGSAIEMTKGLTGIGRTSIKDGLLDTRVAAWRDAFHEWLQTVELATADAQRSNIFVNANDTISIRDDLPAAFVQSWLSCLTFSASLIRFLREDAFSLISMHQERFGQNLAADNALEVYLSHDVQSLLEQNDKHNAVKLSVMLINMVSEESAFQLFSDRNVFLGEAFNQGVAIEILQQFFMKIFGDAAWESSFIWHLLNLDRQLMAADPVWYSGYAAGNAVKLGISTYMDFYRMNLKEPVTTSTEAVESLVTGLVKG